MGSLKEFFSFNSNIYEREVIRVPISAFLGKH